MSEQRWEIGDCLDLLPSIEDKSIDMILTDLPYGTTACAWDTIIPFEPLWEQYKRIIKDDGAIVLTASQPFTSSLIMSNIDMFKYEWIWEKSTLCNFAQIKGSPGKVHENILVFSSGTIPRHNGNPMKYNPQDITKKNKKTTYKYGGNNVFMPNRKEKIKHGIQTHTNYPTSIIKTNNNIIRHHPTQKPVALFEYLVKTYTNEGDMVHDSCLGSGTTLEACMNTNRNCIGFEISDEWEEHYIKRLRLDNSKLDMWC